MKNLTVGKQYNHGRSVNRNGRGRLSEGEVMHIVRNDRVATYNLDALNAEQNLFETNRDILPPAMADAAAIRFENTRRWLVKAALRRARGLARLEWQSGHSRFNTVMKPVDQLARIVGDMQRRLAARSK